MHPGLSGPIVLNNKVTVFTPVFTINFPVPSEVLNIIKQFIL